jgi:hypothetical protein
MKKMRAKLQLVMQNVTVSIAENQRPIDVAEQLFGRSTFENQGEQAEVKILREGYLWKQSKVIKMWRKRWIVLTSSHLYSFKNESDSPGLPSTKETDPTESSTEFIRLDECACVGAFDHTAGQRHVMCIDTPDRTLLLSAASESERDAWTEALHNACLPLMILGGFRGRHLSRFSISEAENESPRSGDEELLP